MPRLVRLDHRGIGEVLKSGPVREEIDTMAARVAGAARSSDEIQRHNLADSVETESYETDRAAAAVTITHPAGLPLQAKYGTLSQAAGEAGLEVRGEA